MLYNAFIMGLITTLLTLPLSEVVIANDTFKLLATYRGMGNVSASVVGPGPTQDSERLYQSYVHSGSTFEIVSIDPDTGAHEVFASPVSSEKGARAMVVGADGNIYVGTLPRAHILRLNPRNGEFKDMGRPSKTEHYIWQLTLGSDQKLYGATYPSAKLIRFDPTTGKGEDLGRMDAKEQYARTIAASDDGFIYTGIGSQKTHIVAYEIATGRHRDILHKKYQVRGFAKVLRGEDGKVYGQIGKQHFRLEGWQATPISASDATKEPPNRLKDKRSVQTKEGTIRLSTSSKDSEATHSFRYAGKEIAVFRLGLGPDGIIYGSTALPIHFFSVNPKDGGLKELGTLGGGEFYSFLSYGKYLLGAAYGGKAPLMIYSPGAPFSPEEKVNANPRLVDYKGQDKGWRPHAMITGPGNKIYLGALAGYGQFGGALTVWDVKNNHVESFPHVVKDQSVISLTTANDLIIGGTTVRGGGGTRSTQSEAKLFIWDPNKKQKLFEIVPIPKAQGVSNLITAPNGLVYGIAKSMLFVFDPAERKVVHTAKLPFKGAIYNSVGVGQDKQIWGLAPEGIFTINPQNNTIKLVAKAPEKITAGFALQGNNLYYASGSKVYSYKLP